MIGEATIPEAGNPRAIVRALDACGLLPLSTGPDTSAFNIPFHCPEPTCKTFNRAGNIVCEMRRDTTQWICLICEGRFGPDRNRQRGNMTTLLERCGVYRKWIDGEIVYFNRDDWRAGTARSGSGSNLHRHLDEVAFMLRCGMRTTDIIAALRERHGLSRTAAYDRLRAVKQGKGGKRTLRELPMYVRRKRILDQVRSSTSETGSL